MPLPKRVGAPLGPQGICTLPSATECTGPAHSALLLRSAVNAQASPFPHTELSMSLRLAIRPPDCSLRPADSRFKISSAFNLVTFRLLPTFLTQYLTIPFSLGRRNSKLLCFKRTAQFITCLQCASWYSAEPVVWTVSLHP